MVSYIELLIVLERGSKMILNGIVEGLEICASVVLNGNWVSRHLLKLS